MLCLQVLMLIDASFGFEMETFEFLNICQVHGFPRIMGVLTHLDTFKNNKTLRKTKKNLKHRFWTEVYQVNPRLYSWKKVAHWCKTSYVCDNIVTCCASTTRGPNCFICLAWCMVSIRTRRWRTSAASSPSWSFVLWCGRHPIPTSWLTGECLRLFSCL